MASLHSILELAREADKAENYSVALMNYRLFLKHETGDPQAWSDYAGLLLVMDRHEDCLSACARALEIFPDFEPALLNKASALVGIDSFEEARKIYERLLALNPDRPDYILALQKFMYITGDAASTEPELLRALEIEPDNIDVLNTLISVYMIKNDLQKYRLYAEKLIDIKFKDSDKYLWEKSVIYLRLGDFREGFRLFEHRPSNQRKSGFNEPLWTGKPFSGRTLLLRWEQGFGDTIMMLRYGPMVKALGGAVILYVQNDLADLAKTCDGFDYVITNKDNKPNFDFQLPLMSLPLVSGTELNTIPAQIPYLKVPPIVKNREAIIDRLNNSDNPDKSDKLNKPNKSKKIGLVWAGGKLYQNDRLRSISPAFLPPFGRYTGAAWYSLQRETPDLIPFDGVIPMADLMDSFADTAFVVSSMDLIVTVDTAMAHLAGALGKPTMLMLPFKPDWRWMLTRKDSPWYPSMQIYRQPSEGNWEDVIEAVINDLIASRQNSP